MIRSTIVCGSSLFSTENMVENNMSSTEFPQYDWECPTMINGPDDPDPKTAKQARVAIRDGPDEEDPQQAEEPLSCFFAIFLYGYIEIPEPKKTSSHDIDQYIRPQDTCKYTFDKPRGPCPKVPTPESF